MKENSDPGQSKIEVYARIPADWEKRTLTTEFAGLHALKEMAAPARLIHSVSGGLDGYSLASRPGLITGTPGKIAENRPSVEIVGAGIAPATAADIARLKLKLK